MRSLVLLVIALAALGQPFEASAQTAPVQWSGFAGDAQHTAGSRVASQSLDRIRWQTPVDLHPQDSGGALLIHYGSPVVTAGNTVIVPVKVTRVGLYRVEGHNGSDGTLLWKLSSDYLLPPHNWTPSFNPALTPSNRLYFPGAGGTLLYRDQPDAATGPTGRVAFYGLSNFDARPGSFTRSVMINTPLTSDSAGNVYFGFQVDGSAPLNLKSGIARVAPDGTGTWIAASDAANDATSKKVVHNSAPALSRDGGALYVAVNNGDGTSGGPGYLLKLNSQTLAPIARVRL